MNSPDHSPGHSRGDTDQQSDPGADRSVDRGEVLSGDQAAFEALARQVIEPVRRYLARRTDPTTAADVLSEVLLVLWRRLEDVPPEAPLPYAYTVARNCLHNAQRSALRQQRLAERIAVIDPPAHAVPAHHDERGEQAGRWGVDEVDVRRAIAALPEASAEVVRLWAWEQLSPAQIATVVGSSANAVSIRLHRAKKQLAQALAVPAPPAGPPPRSGPLPSSDAPDQESHRQPHQHLDQHVNQRPDQRPDQRPEQERRQR